MNEFKKIIPKQIRVLTGEGRPVIVDDHISLGPFVRVSETSDKTLLYVLAFFSVDVGIKGPDFDCLIKENTNELTLKIDSITPTEFKNKNEERQCLTSFVFELDGFLTKSIKIDVIVNFNHKKVILTEPKRGTKVILPGETVKK